MKIRQFAIEMLEKTVIRAKKHVLAKKRSDACTVVCLRVRLQLPGRTGFDDLGSGLHREMQCDSCSMLCV